MEVEQPSYSAFHMHQALESINNGVSRFNLDQIFPISGNVSGAIVGQGSASGPSTFQFTETSNWWSPIMSYFYLRVAITKGDGSVINNTVAPGTVNSFVTYCDNFACTLFTQILSYINTAPLDTVNQPWIIDTALGYSKAHWNYIKTYASMTRMGEGLQTRLLNVSQNNGVVEVIFRPPISLLDVKILPPGAQFRFDFNWAASAINAFESLQQNPITLGDSGTNTYKMTVQSFSFYKASYTPAPGLILPKEGIIDLSPASNVQYPIVAANEKQSQITLPGTTNRILVAFQDTNSSTTVSDTIPVNITAGVGGGYNPATSFSTIFTAQGAGANPTFSAAVKLRQLYLSLPEIGVVEPKPPYMNLDSNNQDMIRAYTDWAHICQGTSSNYEGSIPFGNNDPSKGTQIINIRTDADAAVSSTFPANGAKAIATPLMQVGDPNNYQQFNVFGSGITSPNVLSYNQTCRWGWSGSRPGPIFAFPVVRPDYKKISNGTLYVTLSAAAESVTANVIASYSMAIGVQDTGNGLYQYTLIDGV